MGSGNSQLFLVKSPSRKTIPRKPSFRTGETILQSGIYRVIHRHHRLPHEVTLLRDEQFPKCGKCQDQVFFELVRGVVVAEEALLSCSPIRLYELPSLDGDQGIAV